MGHNIAMIDGKPAMMFVGETPWHKLGARFDKPPATAAEAIKAAQLDWQVVKKPVYAFDGGAFCALPGHMATVRADLWGKPDCAPFGLVGEGYQVLQNRDAFAFFDPVVESGKVVYETAGALGDGGRVWVLAKVQGDIELKGKDRIERYLLLSNGHDGHTAMQVRFTPVRVVCQNTLNAALDLGHDLLKTHHGHGLVRRVERTQNAMKSLLGHYDDLAKHFERMAGVAFNHEKLGNYVKAVFPTPRRKANQSERSYEEAVARNQNLRDTSARLFEQGHGNSEPAIRGTLWTAYNGITEMVDHHLAYPDRWRRMESLCFGDGERTKQRAFDVALDFSRN